MVRGLVVAVLLFLVSDLYGQIIASHESGFYPDSFNLSLKASDPSLQIRYTLNGNPPDHRSRLFAGSVTIGESSLHKSRYSDIPTTLIPDEPDYHPNFHTWKKPEKVLQANILRAALFDGRDRVSEIRTFTYFLGSELAEFTFPIFSIAIDSNSFFHHDTGIYIPGASIDTLNRIWTGNYQMHGRMSERLCHVQFFKDQELVFEQNAGVRIHGFVVASAPQKGLRLYARKEYGKRWFKYPFFPQVDIDRFKRLILRSPYSCDEVYFTDPYIQDVARTIGQDVMASTPAIVFLNGEYWGIHNLRERMDKWYMEGHYPEVHRDSVDVVVHDVRQDEGDAIEYCRLIDYVEANDLTPIDNFNVVDSMVDIANFIDYMIIETYFDNWDWGGNNVKFWKQKNRGKWRMLLIDCDKTLKDPVNDKIALVANGNYDLGKLMRAFMRSPEFRARYYQRYAELLQTCLAPSALIARLDSFERLYTPELERHSERWTYPHTDSSFRIEMERYPEFFKLRKKHYLSSFVESFDPSHEYSEFEQVESESIADKPEWTLSLTHVLAVVMSVLAMLIGIYFLRSRRT